MYGMVPLFDCRSIKNVWKDIQEAVVVTCWGYLWGGVMVGTGWMMDWGKRIFMAYLKFVMLYITS